MERKLIKQGAGGCTVYLPKQWIDSNNLVAGQVVSVTEVDNTLLIAPHERGPRTTSVHIQHTTDEDVRTLVTHAYRRGFDRIEVHDLNAKQQQLLRKTVNELLIGFETTIERENSYLLESVSEPTSEQYPVLLRRSFHIIQQAIKILYEGYVHHNLETETLHELRVQHDRCTLFCRRSIARNGTQRFPLVEWETLTFLMHIMHSIEYTGNALVNDKPRQGAKGELLLTTLSRQFKEYTAAYWEKDIRAIHKINAEKQEFLFGTCFDILKESEKNERVFFSLLRETLRLIQVGTSPILARNLEEVTTAHAPNRD